MNYFTINKSDNKLHYKSSEKIDKDFNVYM